MTHVHPHAEISSLLARVFHGWAGQGRVDAFAEPRWQVVEDVRVEPVRAGVGCWVRGRPPPARATRTFASTGRYCGLPPRCPAKAAS